MKKKLTVPYFLLLVLVFFVSLKLFSNDSIIQENSELPQSDKPNPIKIIFAGDINFDRYVRRQAKIKGNYNYIFDDLRDIFSEADLVVANLEGPITNFDSISMGSEIGSTRNYFFTFPVETAKVLYDENLHLVNIGNNHIYNFGSGGLEQTRKNLEDNNVNYFGHTSKDQAFEDEIYIKNFNDYKVMFVNYNQFIETDLDKLLANISKTKNKADFIILYTHWGLEYNVEANYVMQDLAQKFIDSGVDLIIGSHPHVVQQTEVYKGKTIYYSLGNFIFDQYFDKYVKEGLLVEVTINPLDNNLNFVEYETLIELDSSVSLK